MFDSATNRSFQSAVGVCEAETLFSSRTSCLTEINGSRQRLNSMRHRQFVSPMKFFTDTHTKRHTAFVMLLVWLFALASSAANACFLQTDQPHSRAAKKLAAMTVQAPAGLHTQSGTDAGHYDGSDGTKESCLKVCDYRPHPLSKTWAGVDHTDPGPALLIATAWTGTPNVVSASSRSHDAAIPIVAPPLRVRYSRLAL